MRVLLVEDDSSIRSFVEEVLSLRGHAVSAYGDAEEAWEASQRESYPLNILDWILPGMDGLELCRRIRALPDGDSRLVLCLTARNELGDLTEVLQAGANDFLPKPFDLSALETRLAIVERQVAQLAERKRLEAALAHRALHDPLTELPNRVLLYDRLSQALRLAHREQQPLSLLIIDLDRFKQINDSLGHPMGDEVLRQASAALQGALRAVDTVARLGGDEFAVILNDVEARAAGQVAWKLHAAMAQAANFKGRVLALDASIGIAVFPEHGRDADTLLRNADAAMYAAKRAGSGIATYEKKHDMRGASLGLGAEHRASQ